MIRKGPPVGDLQEGIGGPEPSGPLGKGSQYGPTMYPSRDHHVYVVQGTIRRPLWWQGSRRGGEGQGTGQGDQGTVLQIIWHFGIVART